MSTTTLDRADAAQSTEQPAGFFSRFWDSIVASKQAQADAFLRPYLAQASVSDLAQLGFTSAEIADIKKDRHPPVTSWI